MKIRLFIALIAFTLTMGHVFGADMFIDSYESSGDITWTNTVQGASYGIIWASSLDGPWSADWNDQGLVLATGSTCTSQVPFFFRVVQWPTDGLVGYYPFTLNTDDNSTNGYATTPTDVTHILDRTEAGGAYLFNGSSSHIDCGDQSSQDGTNGVTVSGWFKTSNTNTYQYPVGKFDSIGGYYLRISSDYVGMYINNSRYAFADIIPITNEWFFVAGTWESMDAKIYLNGVEVDRSGTPFSMTAPSYPLEIGCRFHNGSTPSGPFDGSIDEVRIYNRALSSNEVWALSLYPR